MFRSWVCSQDFLRLLLSTALWSVMLWKVWTSVETVQLKMTSVNLRDSDAPSLTFPSVTFCPRYMDNWPNRSRAVDMIGDYKVLRDVGEVVEGLQQQILKDNEYV